jgi:outer membrane protein assembly factor BamB
MMQDSGLILLPYHRQIIQKSERAIINGTKRGDAYALDAASGHILWKLPVGIQYNTEANATANGTGPVLPGSHGGVEYPTANDNKTAYFAISNMCPDNFFSTQEDFCQFVVDALAVSSLSSDLDHIKYNKSTLD